MHSNQVASKVVFGADGLSHEYSPHSSRKEEYEACPCKSCKQFEVKCNRVVMQMGIDQLSQEKEQKDHLNQ
jgi:hypothetical protein